MKGRERGVPPARENPPPWAVRLNRLSDRALRSDPAGAGFRLNRVIDAHKLLTGPVFLVAMLVFDVRSAAAWTYLALHGSYGFAWVLKDWRFPDRKWQRRVGWGAAALTWVFLTLYWVAPALLIAGEAGLLSMEGWDPAAPPVLALAAALYILGLGLMLGADIQKNAAPSGRLLTTGFYARTRHPNYLGEMLVYGSFALVVDHWAPWLILAAIWGLFFLPNMLAIDASLSRYPEFAAWRERTGFLLPRILG